MSYIKRKIQIIEFLNEYKALSIDQLMKRLYISRSTLRRDLIQMEKEGLVKRYHGAVTLAVQNSNENAFSIRKMQNQEKKSTISKYAYRLVHDNMTLFLDSSTTVQYLCPKLQGLNNLNIITNGLNISKYFQNFPSINCYICPGLLKKNSMSIIGQFSSDFLKNFSADIVFFSCKAINVNGVFEGDDSQAMTKRNMFKYSQKKVLLCDNTKEYSSGYFKLIDFKDIDVIITNDKFSDELRQSIMESGCKLIES